MSPFTPPGETRNRVYRYVRERLEAGYPPTIREVQGAMGFRAVQTAREHLERLVSEGSLAKRSGKARGYYLPQKGMEGLPSILIPLLGRVQAGGLNAAIEFLEGYIPARGKSSENLFALRVQGESMTGIGILPGDIVVVRSQPTAESGNIIVALVNDEATVKRLQIYGCRIELHPENPNFEPIVPRPEQFFILGKVIETRRYLEVERF